MFSTGSDGPVHFQSLRRCRMFTESVTRCSHQTPAQPDCDRAKADGDVSPVDLTGRAGPKKVSLRSISRRLLADELGVKARRSQRRHPGGLARRESTENEAIASVPCHSPARYLATGRLTGQGRKPGGG